MRLLVVTAVAVVVLLVGQVTVAGASVAVDEYSPDSVGLRISGGIPRVRVDAADIYQSNLEFEEAINQRIADIWHAFGERARSVSAISLEYETEHIVDGYYHFIVIYADIVSSTHSREVGVVGFDAHRRTILSLEDVLGPNAQPLARAHIAARMRAQPGLFNSVPTSDGVGLYSGKMQRFYTRGGYVMFLFDQGEIAPARSGVVRIPLERARVHNTSFAPHEYIRMDEFNLKMVPLRAAVEGLGFSLEWDDGDNAILISRADTSPIRVRIGQNLYEQDTRPPMSLESPPILHQGLTFVPISFFETILGAFYSTNEHGVVTITIM